MKLIFAFFVFLALSCNNKKEDFLIVENSSFNLYLNLLTNNNSPICYYESIMIKNGLVDVAKIDSTLIIDMKYASEDNFMKINLYNCLQKAYLLEDVALMLKKSSEYLNQLHPGFRIIVYDAARPQQVQQLMWDSFDKPFAEKIKFLSNPKNGSLHNFGAAIDVSIVDSNGDLLDMGTEFDCDSQLSYPNLENYFLSIGKLTNSQINNRLLLRKVMREGGFSGIQTEWWHFNALKREYALKFFKIIK